jgi:hypothetical protein
MMLIGFAHYHQLHAGECFEFLFLLQVLLELLKVLVHVEPHQVRFDVSRYLLFLLDLF